MSVKPVISIIVPTCKRPLLLKRALLSLLLQIDAPPFEVIVADGCPSSNTRSLYENWFLKVAGMNKSLINTEYVAAKTKGPSQTKNLGIKKALGRYIAILDDDDMLLPYALRTAIELAEKLRADILLGHVISTVTCREAGSTPNPYAYIEYVKPRDYYCARLKGEHWGIIDTYKVHHVLFDEKLYASEKTTYLLQWLEANRIVHVKLPLRIYEQRNLSVTRTFELDEQRLLYALLDYVIHVRTHLEKYLEMECVEDLCTHYVKRMARVASLLRIRKALLTALKLYQSICTSSDNLIERLIFYMSLNSLTLKLFSKIKILKTVRFVKTTRKCNPVDVFMKSFSCYKGYVHLLEAEPLKFVRKMMLCMRRVMRS